MKKLLMISSLFFMISCASTEQPKIENNNPIGNIGKVLEKITLPK